MAALIRNARVGCMVKCDAQVNPAMLAKMAVTVDPSNGRLEFPESVPVGEAEHRGYGIEFRSGTRVPCSMKH